MIGLHTIPYDIFTEMCNTPYKMNRYMLRFFKTQNSTFNKFINPGALRPKNAVEINGYFYKLISEGINKFIECRVLCFKAPGLKINSAKEAKYIFGFSCL